MPTLTFKLKVVGRAGKTVSLAARQDETRDIDTGGLATHYSTSPLIMAFQR